MTAVSLSFECCLVFARLSFDRRSTVVRPSLSTGNELEWWGVVISGAKVVQKNGMCKERTLFLKKSCISYLASSNDYCKQFSARPYGVGSLRNNVRTNVLTPTKLQNNLIYASITRFFFNLFATSIFL